MKKYIRSLLSVALSLSVLLSVSLYALAAPKDTRFTDVAPGIWYADAVTYCRKNNLMNGTADALFSPDDTMSRATLVTVLYRLSGGPAAAWVNPFSDVAADAWYHDAVVWAFHENLVDGYGDAQFGPNDPVSREQFAAILWRKAGEPWPQTEILSFSDRSELSNWSFRAVLWAMETGLFKTENPKTGLTRREMPQGPRRPSFCSGTMPPRYLLLLLLQRQRQRPQPSCPIHMTAKGSLCKAVFCITETREPAGWESTFLPIKAKLIGQK